jgi:hypothetical protein
LHGNTANGGQGGRGSNLSQGGGGGDGAGGALFSTGGNVTVVNSTASSNRALGGGLGATPGSAAPGTGDGGAVFLQDGTLDLQSVTLTRNESDTTGGGIAKAGGMLNAFNSILAGNASATAANVAGTLDTNVTNLIDVDPQLRKLNNNGGLTKTHSLKPASPVLDAATAACRGLKMRPVFALQPGRAVGERVFHQHSFDRGTRT